MDILYFLHERTKLIRYYYDVSAGAFLEIQRKIEAAEPPFDDPPYDESGEPPYLEEWSDAARGVVLAGRSAVTMLASAMDLYFKAWERDLGVSYGQGEQRKLFDNGKLRGYQQVFEHFTRILWNESQIDLDLLEQVVIARNADQHGGDLVSIHARYPDAVRKRVKRLFFVSDTERKWQEAGEEQNSMFFFGSVEAPRDILFKAIEELDKLADWLEPQLLALYQGRSHNGAAHPVNGG
jgi:hypothetical protein